VTVKSISDNAESVKLPFRIFTTLNYITQQHPQLDISALQIFFTVRLKMLPWEFS
jgi:hypothetical protein